MGVPEEGRGHHEPPDPRAANPDDSFRMLVDAVDEYAVFMLDRDGRVTTWNRGAERLKGYAAAEVLGSHLSRFYPPGTPRERVVEHLEEAEREGRYREEGWRVRKDGSLFWADVTLTAVRDAQGQLRGFAKVTKDRTESLRAQQQLQRLAALLSESQRLTHIGSWEWDTVTNDVLWSDELYRIYGLEPTPGTRNSRGGGFLERVHGDDRERVASEMRQALAERRSFSFEHRIVRPDGEARVLLTQGRTVLDEGGKALRMIGTGQDVTDLRSAEREHAAVEGARRTLEARRESEERFRIMADTAPVMVWMAGPDKLCDWFNRPWLEFTGRTLEQELGNGWVEGVHPEDLERCVSTYTGAFDRRESYRTEYRLRRHDGEYRWVLGSGTPRFGPEGFAGYVGSCIDISERREADAERERLLAESRAARLSAEQASRLKDEFLAVLSHELRTPLNAIVGWAHMLRGAPLDEEGRARAVETIHRNAQLQRQLISDVLDISRIVSGKLTLDLQQVDLAAVIEDAADTLRPAAQARQIGLVLELDRAASPVRGDPGRLQQVVWNLLSNAVKFTSVGGSVRVRLARAGSAVLCTVEDDGPGVAPEFLPFVFDRFRQGDSSSTRRHGGLGLGLAICRSLVERHGGEISARNAPGGGGAVFSFRLPALSEGEAAEGATDRATQPPLLDAAPSLKGLCVLVVENDEDSRTLVQGLIELQHGRVLLARSAAEAFQSLQLARPHVVVSDIEMPDEDGYSLLRRVRALPPAQGGLTPAIALTAYARPQDRELALAAGFELHVAKPVDPAELVAAIAALARPGAAERPGPPP
jgi:PAS domain S-box-containing protein